MKTTTRKPYVSSARLGAKLSTSDFYVSERLDNAFESAGIFKPGLSFSWVQGTQDSEIIATLSNGVVILVSYQTVVAFRLPGSKNVAAVTLGHHSRTTDRSIRDFALKGTLVELTPSAFLEAVADAAAL